MSYNKSYTFEDGIIYSLQVDDYCFALRSELDTSGINSTWALWSNHTKGFWKSPRGTVIRIEVLVVLAAIMLLFLIIFGSWRRKRRSSFIQNGVLGAYTLSSSVVTYLLGSMQSSVVKSSMYPIWAISLYIIFGCADSITAYSIDDNNQTTRLIYQTLLYYAYALLITLSGFSKNNGAAFLLVLLMVIIGTMKFTHRMEAHRLARASWNLNKVVADYMYQEHNKSGPSYDAVSMKGYHYLVEWPLGDSELESGGTLYATKLTADSVQVVDMDKVWHCNAETLSQYLKETCLSFSLFHLLRRRFFGYECGEAQQPKTHDFVFKGLLAKNEVGAIDYDRVFKVIEVELAFMYDFFFTKYATVHYRLRNVIYLSWASGSLISVIAVLAARGLLPFYFSNRPDGSIILDTTEAEVIITALILGCIALIEVLQPLHYWTTIWGRVSLACQLVRGEALKKQGGCSMRFKEILANNGLSLD